MQAEVWQRIAALFAEAAALAPAERNAFVVARSGSDPELRQAVERLIAADAAAEEQGFLAVGNGPGSAEIAPVTIGRYRIEARLGRGGFGEVFRAFDSVLKRPVAVKTCLGTSEEERRRFVREAEIAARLEHPNITRVYDFGLEGDVPYLVQELLDGEDLTAWIERQPRPSLDTCLGWLLHAARGLAYAHAHGVVHRDIKPSNLRVLPNDAVKILDFGIARGLDTSLTLATGGQLLGTVAYMAPERLRETNTSGARPDVDVFAWGAVAWELLAGRRRLRGESPLAQLYEAVQGKGSALSEAAPQCSAELTRIVERCLSPAAHRRYREAGELVADLEPLAAEQAEPARRDRRTGARAIPRRKATAWWIGAAVSAAMAVALWRFAAARPADHSAPAPLIPAARATLRIDARPWAVIEAITEVSGNDVPLPEAQAVTPLAIEVGPGRYTVRLRHPSAPESRTCSVRVADDIPSQCTVEFVRPAVVSFLAEAAR